MKKVVCVIVITLIFFVIYFLQANFFNLFTIAGVKPNLFILLMLILGLFAGKKPSVPLGIVLGIVLDLLSGKIIGISSIMFVIIVILADIYDKNFSKDNRMTIMVMVISTTIIYELGIYILSIFKLSINFELISFVKILMIEAIYNALLTIIMYPIIQKLGALLEENFKEQNILTRYF
ncbi:MAG: rod shape-determining protein MreD [Clostridia bacterium]|nr:rod shape-determining protein MreD [Clostridia bacterium]